MAIEIRFNRLVVLKESVVTYCTEPTDQVASLLWQMYAEDEYLMGSSSMGYEVDDVSERLQELGLVMNRDMVIVTGSSRSSGTPWLEVGHIDNTVVCWRSGFNPRPITRHYFVNSEMPKDHAWVEELTKFGIRTEMTIEEEGVTAYNCLRGEARITLYEAQNSDSRSPKRLISDPPELARRAFRRLDHELMGDIQFALWRISEESG